MFHYDFHIAPHEISSLKSRLVRDPGYGTTEIQGRDL